MLATVLFLFLPDLYNQRKPVCHRFEGNVMLLFRCYDKKVHCVLYDVKNKPSPKGNSTSTTAVTMCQQSIKVFSQFSQQTKKVLEISLQINSAQ